ncbi:MULTISPECIES: FAD-dependent monooxygenase [Actinoalloteichus]|uniref:2-polyprenyl-6-methoxyphenol hydroxylase-like oxidoreductase n=1 Tax=Actinoalloteichus fjordicus TaxID=1612552 RepID=A0AAC9PS22_9PSEU|nr:MULTISPECIES: FAD-dependent monooxygenase [Actinoalloteichus]APU15064.1 2-polyprenyl-6-methoxyphenol hydroxylase-like oxidoreductase [Actinoalloteichus fjordicus]APU21132.1 2-polyprenyl-6-methoxyphenol hydroxylase-like oxidoreductase [Actinoalloteichus sp. GBA129-24]
MIDVDVVIVGAGPVGLLLAGELRRAGVRPLVLERQPQTRDIPRANGLSGQILELLRYRGLLDRFEAAGVGPAHPAPRFPFGEVHLDFTGLADPPLRGLHLPQPQLERLLDEHARELDVDIRRRQEIIGVSQDGDTVTAEVHGPDGPYQVRSRYLVGCDGARSRVRDRAGIPFPGTTYPEVNRLGQVTTPDAVAVFDDGHLDVPGLGRIRPSFIRTDRGVFGIGALTAEMLLVSTTEFEPAETDDDTPMSLTELQDSIRRVLDIDIPLGDPIRLSRYRSEARQAARYRDGRIMLAGDAAHLFPATGVGLNAGMLDAVNLAWKLAADLHGWAPPGLLDTYHDERHVAGARTMLHTQAQVALRRGQDAAAQALREVFLELFVDEQPLRRIGALISGADIRYPVPDPDHHALAGTFAPDLALHTDQGATSVAELLHSARPVLLDLADRQDLRDIARGWQHRVDVRSAEAESRPADALLIRPDAHIAWAATVDEPVDTASAGLRDALARWFGAPRETPMPVADPPA